MSCAALLALSLATAAVPFETWVEGVKAEAKKRGISDQTLKALDGIAPIPRVIELDRKQPEKTFTFDQYAAKVVTEERIANGRRVLQEHADLLKATSEKYGVQPEYIVALFGVETAYGTILGDYSVVAALATLAHEGRRAAFFRRELLDALAILDKGHITAEAMKGSWAGAMGNCQFMPSTFLAYAADGDGDGKSDIWGSRADTFASIARYLKGLRWKQEPWGLEVQLPEGFPQSELGLSAAREIGHWKKAGVRTAGGGELPSSPAKGSIVRPGDSTTRAFLVFDNFRATLRWNRSQYFATAVGLVADGVRAGPAPVAKPAAP